MAVSFRFLSSGIVYIRYTERVDASESIDAFARYARHPERVPGQAQLVDLSEVTSYDHDIVSILRMQAEKATLFSDHQQPTLVVYYAPTPTSYTMARISQRSWEGLPGVIPRIAEDEIGALDLLGRAERSFVEFMAET